MRHSELDILRAAKAWREAGARVERHRPSMTAAEMTGDAAAIRSETERADTLFDELQAARDAVYGMSPPTLRAALAILVLIREAEEDAFEDPLLQNAMDEVLRYLQTLV